MTGKQEPGKMWDKDIDYSRGIEMDMNENSTMKERACCGLLSNATPAYHEGNKGGGCCVQTSYRKSM